MSDQEVGFRLTADDQASAKINRVHGALGDLGTKAGLVNKGIGEMGSGLGVAAQKIERLGMIAGTVAVGGLVASIKAAGDFGAQLNVINTIAMVTPDKLTVIGKGIRDLAVSGGGDLTDLTAAYYDLLSAGVSVGDAQGDLTLAFKLSKGALSTTNEAVDFLTTAVNSYKLTQAQTTVVADEFAQAVADGKVKMSEISATFANVASVAKSAGIGIDQIAASYGYLTAQGVPATEVTTEMNRAIVELMKPGHDLVQLQDKMKVNYADLAKQKGLVPALEQMRIDAEATGVPFQNLFGRLEGYKYALQTTGPAFAGFQAEQQKIINSTGEMNAQYDERQQGLNYQLARTKAALQSVAITIGNDFLPVLGDLTGRFADWLASPDTQKGADDLAKSIAGIFSPANIDAAEGFVKDVLPGLKSGLEMTLSIAKDAWGFFNALPPEVKAIAIAAIAGDKLTGGLVRSGLVDIGKGLLQSTTSAGGGVLGGMLGVQKVFVVNMAAGGLGGASGAAGAAGTAASGGGLLGKVAILGSVAIAGASIYELAQTFQGFQHDVGQAQSTTNTQVADWKALPTSIDSNTSALNAEIAAMKENHSNPLTGLITTTFAGSQESSAILAAADKLANGVTITPEGIDSIGQAFKAAADVGNVSLAQALAADYAKADKLARVTQDDAAKQWAATNGTTGAVNSLTATIPLLDPSRQPPPVVNVAFSVSVQDISRAQNNRGYYGGGRPE